MFTVDQTIFIETAIRKYGEEAIIGRKELLDLKQELSQPYPTWFIDRYKVGHGKYKIPGLEEKTVTEKPEQKPIETPIDMLKSVKEEDITIIAPEVDSNYVQFGFFSDLEKIIKSKEFFPVMITGNHGNGKTALVAQVCAKLNRPLIRVNVHKETDEVALIGGPTLINGNIVYKDGPILTAMRCGHVVNIDEIDRASGETLLCLNSIMEGSPFYNKHTGEIIHPAKGFNIVATANTKGFGAQGKFLSQILDEAFLERFVITIEQEYPNIKIEKQILSKVIDDEEFIDTLCKWSQVIRESFYQNAIDSLISTRRLLHIAKTYKVFKNKLKAIEFCLNRFEEEEKMAFLDLYKKIANPEELSVSAETTDQI